MIYYITSRAKWFGGYIKRRIKMNAKRVIAVLLASVIALGLISCGTVEKNEKDNSTALQNESVSDSYSEDYEFAKNLTGMDLEDAKSLMKDTFSGEEKESSITTDGYKRKVYSYVGSFEFLGQKVHSAYIVTGVDSGGKVTGFGVTANYCTGINNTEYMYDYAQTEQRFDSFKTTLTKKYGEPKSAEIDGGCHYKECEWADEQIRLEHSYNYIDKEKVTDLQTTLAFGDSGGVCFIIADDQWS